MNQKIHEVLKKYWGYSSLRPLQEEIIQSVLNRKDTLALMPTGGGKSLCFQLPAIMMDGICIVITPLIALMKDQVEQLKKRGIPAIAVYSGLSKKEIDIALDNCVYGSIKFLYVSPERIQTEIFRERVKKMKVCLLAIDEAHCISQWGYDFRPAYLKISELRALLPKIGIVALTATATEIVKKDIQEKLLFKDQEVFQKSFARSNLSYSVFLLESKENKVLEILKNVPGTSVIYVRSRKRAQDLSVYLQRNRIIADYYHAGLSFEDRSTKQDKWIGEKIRVMVATNAFGMGIDKANVRTVIHWELPESLEAYYQEAGRAGRDEIKAFAILLYNQTDIELLQQKVEEAYPSIDFIKKVYQSLANYYKIAVGSSSMASYKFDLDEFENVYKLPKIDTFYALKRLETEGLIQVNDTFYQPSRFMFLMNHKFLYEFQIANEKYDPIIKTLLRMYGGETFTDFCSINESKVAKELKMTTNEVVGHLKSLEKMEVLEYNEQSDSPSIVFTTPRVDASKLPINVKEIERKKKSDLDKMNSVIHYATQELRCRTLVLLDYFGEVSGKECEVCDVCLKKKRERNLEDKHNEIRSYLLKELSLNPLSIDTIQERNDFFSKDKIIQTIRMMLDTGEIFISDEGIIVLKK